MTYNDYFCNLCGDYIEGYNIVSFFYSYDGVKINNKYYCKGKCEKIVKDKMMKDCLSNKIYILKVLFSVIFL